jgi:hypothetical protein
VRITLAHYAAFCCLAFPATLIGAFVIAADTVWGPRQEVVGEPLGDRFTIVSHEYLSGMCKP